MRDFFPRLIGNGDTKLRIGRAIVSRTVPHAFLIGGPEGSGKSTLATEIAAALNCERKDDCTASLPCGGCNTCRRIYDGNFPDLKILSREGDKATIGAGAVKLFREDMFLSSTESEHKIYIIDSAETMTVEAQNALLKVLEEPPSGVSIILLADECDRILTTIKSRVQYIAMSRFSEEELERYVISRSDDANRLYREEPERFRAVLMSADGRIGRAVKLVNKRFAEENDAERAIVLKIIAAIGGRAQFVDIYSALSALPTKRTELIESLELLMSALRDLILIKEDGTAKLIFYTSPETARQAVGEIGIKRLLHVFDAVNEAHELCIKNANVQNIITNLTSRIKIGSCR